MRLSQTIAFAILVVIALGGCSAKREELGYGFYRLDKPAWQVIRRELDENGDIVDVVWFPDRIVDDEHRLFFGCGVGKDRYYGTIPVSYEPEPDMPKTAEAYLDHLHSTVTFTVLRLDRAEIEELGTYDEYFAQLDESDPARMQVDGGFMVYLALVSIFVPLE